jgi:hypothetical protein
MATEIPDGAKTESRVKRLSRWLKNKLKELTVFALMYNLI